MRQLADRDTKGGLAAELVERCGGFGVAVAAASSLSRTIWRMRSTQTETRRTGKERPVERARLVQTVAADAAHADAGGVESLLDLALAQGMCWRPDSDPQALGFSRSIANPLHVARGLFADLRPDHELKYFVMRDIRRRYRIRQSSEIAHRLHGMADGINQRLLARASQESASARLVCRLRRDPASSEPLGLMDALSAFVSVSGATADMFLECCRVLNYLQPSGQPGEVELRTRFVDAEYVLSWLFGVPTRIKGFDSLFGGGGLMLAEASDDDRCDRIGGRSVLATGPSGSGKSLLTLQMAVEVARKGGAAWVMPLEQTAEECLYALQSIGALPPDSPLTIATTVAEALDLLENPDGEKGALILLRTIKGGMDDFLVAFEENVHLMGRYPLRLIAVDSVSALSHAGMNIADHRARTLQTLESLKQRGTNIWLVAEENAYGRDTQYEQNIADTVISLGVETRHDYSQRYIEVRKSRLQREQRGQHPFAIGPGTGLTVFPSSAAVKSRIKTRALRAPTDPTVFGLPSLDEILGPGGLHVGDVAVLQGPTGCSKTPLGITFLLSPDFEKERRPHCALLVSAEHNEAALRYELEKTFKAMRGAASERLRLPRDVRTLVIDGGYVKPGYILQLIEDEFERARLEDTPIGRVMIDNVAHWELSCPFVRDDRTFGDTLIDLLRAHRVTTLLTCSEARLDSVLSRSVVENADCLIQCDRAEYRGRSRVMLRVVKTRDMGHRGELFELTVGAGSLRVETSASLLRMRPDGRLNSVPVRLFLRADSEAHHAYNRSVQRSVKGVLSRDIELEHDAADQIEAGLRLAPASAIDELQILQLDEFELPDVSNRQPERFGLKAFSLADGHLRHWKEMLPRLRTRASEEDTFLAVPYYVNVALLACRSGVDRMARRSWAALAAECERWERAAPAHSVFFDLPTGRGENYNCLFFEILASLEEVPEQVRRRGPLPQCAFLSWVTSPAAVEAMVMMRRLTRRAWLRRRDNVESTGAPVDGADPSAQVWRHWFGTLHQMCSEMGAEQRAGIEVGPLPGEVSVAGEWFLAIPSYSAAPEVGLRVIDMLTSPEAELDRLKAGVGLPTRDSFFLEEAEDLGISPFFSMGGDVLRRIVERAVRRSDFGCYRRAASTVSAHLQAIVAAPLAPGEDPTPLAMRHRDDLRRRLELVVDDRCRRCGGV